MLRKAHLALLRVFRVLPRRVRLGVVHLLSPSFTVGAICVIERADGALLLVRHSYRERWGLPGGLLERGEEADAGARREAFEEVGLEIELEGEPAVVIDPRARRVDVVFRAHPRPGADPEVVEPRSPEVVDVAWFAAAALPELQHETAGALVALARVTASPAARPASAS